ncbi:MAG: ribosome-associated translation inhibitor RaiA [bacterium]
MMDLVVINRGGEVTPDIQQHLEKKLKKLQRIISSPTELHVVIAHERADRGVEVSIHAYGQDFYADERGEDLCVCVDSALEKLVAQVKKRKERVKDHSPRP